MLGFRSATLVAVTLVTGWLSVRIATGTDPWNAIVPAATLVPAWVVLLRREWHVVGWLLLAVAAMNAAQFWEIGSMSLISPEWIAWIYSVLNVGFWAAMAALVAVFPDGTRTQEGGPGLADRIIVVVVIVATVLAGLTSEVQAAGWEGPTEPPLYDSPLGAGFLPIQAGLALMVIALVAFGAATLTLVVRTRRATGAVRQQHRWVLFPFAVLIVGVPVAILISELRGVPGAEWLIAIFGYIAIPVCFGIAMTRYRLYDIGKIISRTVAYTVVVASLAAVYFGLVTVVTALLQTQNSLAVAAATLAAAALFNPLRKRTQRAVDRRFNRSAYQSEVVSAEFAAQLRESLTIEQLTQLWTSTTISYLQPVTCGAWVSTRDTDYETVGGLEPFQDQSPRRDSNLGHPV